MLEKLRALATDQVYCELYRGAMRHSSFGYVLRASEAWVVLQTYDRDGLYDGLLFLPTNHVTSLRWGGNYLRARERFAASNLFREPELEIDDEDDILAMLRESDRPASFFHGPEERYVGVLVEYDENLLHVDEYGSPTSLDRAHLITRRDDTIAYEIDSMYLRNLAAIHRGS